MKILDLGNVSTPPIPQPSLMTEQNIHTEDEDISVYGYDLNIPGNEKFAKYLKNIKKTNPELFNRMISLN